MSFDILAHTVNTTGQGRFVVQNTTLTATIIDADTITFDGGATFLSYTYLGQGNYRGTGQSGEFIEVDGQIYAYATDDPEGPLRTGNWQITEGDLDPSNPPCFLPGTLIKTRCGEVPVEQLAAGELVATASGRYAPILWAGSTRVAVSALKRNPALRPVRIGIGAIGNDRELKVSQQHRILFSGLKAQVVFGELEVLVPAKSLLDLQNVTLIGDAEAVVYHHLLLDRHEIIFANGIPVESLFLGDQVEDQVPSEVWESFPEILAKHRLAPAARPLATVKEGRVLVS